MSWRLAGLLINAGGPGYFGTFPVHDGNRARDLLDELGMGDFPHSRFANLEAGLSPPTGYYCLGVYPRGLLAFGLDEFFGAVERPAPGPFLAACLARQPRAETLLFEVSGVSGYATGALYSGGQRQRAFAADDARGVVLDEGPPTPEERRVLAGPGAPSGAHLGEARVFALTARALGVALDQFESERLSIELIAQRRRGPLSSLRRLFGAGR